MQRPSYTANKVCLRIISISQYPERPGSFLQICPELQRTVGKNRNVQHETAGFRSQKNQGPVLELLPILGVTLDKSFTFSGFVRVSGSLKWCRGRT